MDLKYWFVDHNDRYSRSVHIANEQNRIIQVVTADEVVAMQERIKQLEEQIEQPQDVALRRDALREAAQACRDRAKRYQSNTMYPAYCLNAMADEAMACAEAINRIELDERG